QASLGCLFQPCQVERVMSSGRQNMYHTIWCLFRRGISSLLRMCCIQQCILWSPSPVARRIQYTFPFSGSYKFFHRPCFSFIVRKSRIHTCSLNRSSFRNRFSHTVLE